MSSTVFTQRYGKYWYNRSSSAEVEELAEILQKCYHANRPALITPSGMAAIASVLQTQATKYTKVVYPSEAYCDTTRMIETLWSQPEHRTTFDVDKLPESLTAALERAGANDRTLVFLESATNPKGLTCDWESVLEHVRKKYPKLLVVVDNTWLTHVLHPGNTIRQYGDIVVLSLTKHYSNGTTIGGAVLDMVAQTKKGSPLGRVFKEASQWCKFNGLHVYPLAAQRITQEMTTITNRIQRATKRCNEVIAELKTQLPQMTLYHHPGTSLVACVVAGATSQELRDRLVELAESKEFAWEAKTSYGGGSDRICPFIHGTIVRLCVGHSAATSPTQLVADFQRLMGQAFAVPNKTE